MYSIKSQKIQVTAASLGAELASIVGPGGCEYLWQADPQFWPRRSPLLFPIVGALPGGSFTHKGKGYSMGNHGFARDREFRLAAQSREALRFELESDEKSLEIYPFNWKLAVTYRVEGEVLTVGYEVENRGGETMYFSIGAHPAFRAPLEAGERREDYELRFEKREKVRRHFLSPENLRTGETELLLDGADVLPLSPALFERGAVVLREHKSRALRLQSRKSGRFVELRFPGFPQLGIWSPKGEVPFVCLEPWYGVMPLAGSDQELAHKEACLSLEGGAVFKASYDIVIG